MEETEEKEVLEAGREEKAPDRDDRMAQYHKLASKSYTIRLMKDRDAVLIERLNKIGNKTNLVRRLLLAEFGIEDTDKARKRGPKPGFRRKEKDE